MSDGPIKITNASEIAVCTCMPSHHWPVCDAPQHTKGGEPKILELDKTKTYYLCSCYRTKKSPFCDGSHEKVKKA